MAPRTYSDLIGKGFAPGGRGPLQFDCYGLVKAVLERNGIPVPDYPSAEDAGMNASLILAALAESETEQAEEKTTEAGSPTRASRVGVSQWERLSSPEANCVVLFRMDRREGTHVGVMLDGQRFLHALKETGVCVERVDSELWKRRVLGYYRWRAQ